jgi:hypothetical protein
VVLDVNAQDNLRGVNFHYAMLEWEYRKLTLGGGLIALSQFGVQEAFWGKRYIEKSYQDLNGFGFDSDMGLIAKYRFTGWLEADLAVTNGEGTVALNHNRSNKYGAGVTLRPAAGFTLRAYGDTYRLTGQKGGPNATQRTVALFAGYSNSRFSVGAEYNRQADRQLVAGYNLSGYSVYAGLSLGKHATVYARYDRTDTDTYDWRAGLNSDMLVAGFDFRPLKQLSLSPNYRYMKPAGGGQEQHYIALNAGFSW